MNDSENSLNFSPIEVNYFDFNRTPFWEMCIMQNEYKVNRTNNNENYRKTSVKVYMTLASSKHSSGGRENMKQIKLKKKSLSRILT